VRLLSASLILLASCATSREAIVADVAGEVRQRSGLELRSIEPDVVPDASSVLEGPLTADRAVQVALQNNAELQAALEDLTVARGRARLSFENPRASGEVRFRGADQDPAYELEVSQSLTGIVYGARRSGIGSAELEAEKLKAARAALDLAVRVRSAFFEHQADRERSELWRTVTQAAEASDSAARVLYQAGNLPLLEVDRIEAELERAILELSEAESHEAESRTALDVLMGTWGKDLAWKIDSKLPDPPEQIEEAKQIERRAIESSLSLGELRHRIAAAASSAGLAKWEGLLPEIELGVAANREEGDQWEVGPRLEIALPLFDQGSREIAEAQAELRRLQHSYRAEAVRIRAEARSAAARVRAAQERALHYRRVVLPLGERIIEGVQRKVNAMSAGVFELLSAKRDQIDAAGDYVSALEDYWVARARLDQILRGGSVEQDGGR
jgi:outer membrane protein, heavy metal efflux system